MTLLSVLEKQIYAPLIVDSSRSMSLQRFARLALEWQLPDEHVRQALNYFGLGEDEGRLFPVMGGAATPVVLVDASTPLNAGNLNKYVNAEGKVNTKIQYAAINWTTGTTFVVAAGSDSAGIGSGALSWAADVAGWLSIAVAGFTSPPFVGTSVLFPHAVVPTASDFSLSVVLVGFIDFAGVLQLTPDSRFVCRVFIIGV